MGKILHLQSSSLDQTRLDVVGNKCSLFLFVYFSFRCPANGKLFDSGIPRK